MSGVFRERAAEIEQRTTNLELFFDLVFVFAITQVASFLNANLDVTGALRATLLLGVVWWAWNYTTWMTNWFDPDHAAVRTILMLVMLLSLAVAIVIPRAYADGSLAFAGFYVVLQGVRNLFAYGAAPNPRRRRMFLHICAWWAFTGALWIGASLLEAPYRELGWVVALALELLAPSISYWMPVHGRLDPSEWDVEGTHFAERFQLFMIIALGESIVVQGATAAQLDVTVATAAAVAVSFLIAAAIWWLYFGRAAAISQRMLAAAEDPSTIARDGFTYLHFPMVAGIVTSSLGAEHVIAHPSGALHAGGAAVLFGGPALYLIGHVAFRRRVARSWASYRIAAAALLLALAIPGTQIAGLAAAIVVAAILCALATIEQIARGRSLTSPSS